MTAVENNVISRYLGMFSLDQNVQTFVIVLDTVISRYLGMFSLDDIRGIQYTCNVSVISRYLGMFSLDIISECFRQTFFSYFPLSWDVLIRLDIPR